MKLFSICFLLLLSFQVRKSCIKIKGVEKSYSSSDKLDFYINNNCNDKLFYYIGIEYYNDNEWIELINDVANPKSKSSTMLVLKSDETAQKTFTISKLFYKKEFYNYKKYRLKLAFIDGKNNKISQKVYSKSFVIVK